MSTHDEEPMDAELRALLKNVGPQTNLEEVHAVEARVWSKLAAALPGLPAAAAPSAPRPTSVSNPARVPPAPVAPVVGAVSGKAIAVLATVFALGGGLGAWVARATVEPRVVYLDRPMPIASAPASVAVAPAASAASAPPGPASALAPDPNAQAPSSSRAVGAVGAVGGVGAVPSALTSASAQGSAVAPKSGERELVDAARTEFARGYPADCLVLLDQHRVRYSEGVLREEREALAVRALVALGRSAEAQARGKRFVAQYPQSLMRVAVEAAIAVDVAAPASP
jgi:hypothetical protein